MLIGAWTYLSLQTLLTIFLLIQLLIAFLDLTVSKLSQFLRASMLNILQSLRAEGLSHVRIGNISWVEGATGF